MKYWKNIKTATKTLSEGLKVTMKHIKEARGSREPLYADADNYFERENGLFTVQYPKESLPVPDHGRYKLHNEIDDCIVCDKCAKICPVNCIDIEPVRAVGEIGKTSDGTSKRIYAARFDIDMAKCCFCGLCTTVCPTECLTMTKEFDFSTDNIADHNFEFSEMTPLDILRKKKELEAFNEQKAAEKAAKSASAAIAKPQIKPKVAAGAARPVFKPTVTAKKSPTDEPISRPKPVVRPKVAVKKKEGDKTVGDSIASVRPVVRPKVPVRPKIPMPEKEKEAARGSDEKPKALRPKIPVRPKVPFRKPGDDSPESASQD